MFLYAIVLEYWQQLPCAMVPVGGPTHLNRMRHANEGTHFKNCQNWYVSLIVVNLYVLDGDDQRETNLA